MIHPDVLFVASVVVLFILAFFLLPAYEHFKDAKGRETDVSPDAPPKPAGLKQFNARANKYETFVVNPATGVLFNVNTSDKASKEYTATQTFPSDLESTLPSWLSFTEPFDNPPPSHVQVIPPVSVPRLDATSTLNPTPPDDDFVKPTGAPTYSAVKDLTPEETSSLKMSRFTFDPTKPVFGPPPGQGVVRMTITDPNKLGGQTTKPNQVPNINTPQPQVEMGNDYVKKSSLVPCICTTHSMGCPLHGNGKRSSVVPGDQDQVPQDYASAFTKAENQFNIMKPFNMAFQKEDVQPFLNSFNAFTR